MNEEERLAGCLREHAGGRGESNSRGFKGERKRLTNRRIWRKYRGICVASWYLLDAGPLAYRFPSWTVDRVVVASHHRRHTLKHNK